MMLRIQNLAMFLRGKITFIVSLVVLVVIGIVTLQTTRALISTTGEESHSLKVIANLETIVSLVKDAHSSMQGYVITGSEHMLATYKQALKTVPAETEALKQLIGSDLEQQKRLEVLKQLIDAEFAEMAKIVKLRKTKSFKAAARQIRSSRSKDLLDKIRSLSRTVVDDEGPLLKSRSAEVQQAVKITNFVLPCSFVLLVLASFAVHRHIQHRRRTEAELLKAREEALETSRYKSAFLANMSHEIRTPMNGIIGITEIMLETDLNEDQRRYAQLVNVSAHNLLRIINDILDVSKIEAGKIELEVHEFLVRDVVNERVEVATLQASEKRVSLESYIDPEIPTKVLGDSVRLDQILTNLLGNAIKFTEENGHVRIKVTKTGLSDRAVKLKFEVSDTGIGLAEDAKTKLFQPFSQADNSTTRKYGGTGLGLSISRHLVELMEGEIGFESEEGVGSTFWFTVGLALPMVSAEAKSQPKPELKAEVRGSGHRVLLAEDNPLNQLIVVRQLESLGYHVETANNGVEALEKLEQFAYDVVLMDCLMPEMDGYQTTTAIRRQEKPFSKIPIIALTANAMQGDDEICYAAGMDDYLAKPVKKAELAKTIERWCAKPTVAHSASINGNAH